MAYCPSHHLLRTKSIRGVTKSARRWRRTRRCSQRLEVPKGLSAIVWMGPFLAVVRTRGNMIGYVKRIKHEGCSHSAEQHPSNEINSYRNVSYDEPRFPTCQDGILLRWPPLPTPLLYPRTIRTNPSQREDKDYQECSQPPKSPNLSRMPRLLVQLS